MQRQAVAKQNYSCNGHDELCQALGNGFAASMHYIRGAAARIPQVLFPQFSSLAAGFTAARIPPVPFLQVRNGAPFSLYTLGSQQRAYHKSPSAAWPNTQSFTCAPSVTIALRTYRHVLKPERCIDGARNHELFATVSSSINACRRVLRRAEWVHLIPLSRGKAPMRREPRLVPKPTPRRQVRQAPVRRKPRPPEALTAQPEARAGRQPLLPPHHRLWGRLLAEAPPSY
jgi:hypothetical protein